MSSVVSSSVCLTESFARGSVERYKELLIFLKRNTSFLFDSSTMAMKENVSCDMCSCCSVWKYLQEPLNYWPLEIYCMLFFLVYIYPLAKSNNRWSFCLSRLLTWETDNLSHTECWSSHFKRIWFLLLEVVWNGLEKAATVREMKWCCVDFS